MNKAAANAARIITSTLDFFGVSSSDVSLAISTWVVVEMETFPIEEKIVVADEKVVVAASVGVFRCTEEFLKRVRFINGFKFGSMSVTREQQGKREISKKTIFAGKSLIAGGKYDKQRAKGRPLSLFENKFPSNSHLLGIFTRHPLFSRLKDTYDYPRVTLI